MKKPTTKSFEDVLVAQKKANKNAKVTSFDVTVSDNGGFSVRVRPAQGKGEPYSDGKTHVYPDAESLCAWIDKVFAK